jgi:hypothetical protein
MAANTITQLTTANTFQHWLTSTQSLIGVANTLTNGAGNTFYANTRLEVGGTGASLNVVTSATIQELFVSGNTTLASLDVSDELTFNTTTGNTLTIGDLTISGLIDTDQIANGAITAEKLASGAALPSTSGNGTYFLTTDGAETIWKAQSALSIANTQITGILELSQGGTGGSDASTARTSLGLGSESDVRFNSLGVGTASSFVQGEIRATNNITAYYSDKRLKNIKGNIDNALDKVMTLNGVYYENNEVAEKYGYINKEQQVGVLAQDVEQVLPEIVKAAPFDIGQNEDGTEYSLSGHHYKTVQYEKLVPLLLEAIKELKTQLDLLKGKNHG